MLPYFLRLNAMSIIYNLSNSVSFTWKPDNPYCHIVRNRQGIDGKKFVQMPFPLVLLADAKMQRRKTTTHFRTSSRLRNHTYITSEKWLDGLGGWVKESQFCWRSVLYLCWHSRWVGQKSKKLCWCNTSTRMVPDADLTRSVVGSKTKVVTSFWPWSFVLRFDQIR